MLMVAVLVLVLVLVLLVALYPPTHLTIEMKGWIWVNLPVYQRLTLF